MRYPRDKCGVGLATSVFDAYAMLRGLEHRGEECSGMGGTKNGKITALRWPGKIYEKTLQELEKEDGFSDINQFIVHTRYATVGSKEELLKAAHPITLGGKTAVNGASSCTSGAKMAIVHNGQVVDDAGITRPFMKEATTGSDSELLLQMYKKHGIEGLVEQIPASYSIIILDGGTAIGCRDSYGIKPLWLGEKEGRSLLCSEDVPIKKIGGKPVREVKPGEAIYIENGRATSEQLAKPGRLKFCFFEFNYLADSNSEFLDKKVWDVRKALGEKLAEEVDASDADFVAPVPNAGKPYAIGFSEKSGIPYLPILKKKKNERSFIQSTKAKRAESINGNMYLEDSGIARRKSIVLVDDSVIRGNVLESAVGLLKHAGAEKAYLLSGTHIIGGYETAHCFLGVDMPPTDEFIMRKFGSAEKISKYITKKYKIPFELHYISVDGMFDVLGDRNNYCAQCVTGRSPIAGFY